MDTEQQAGTITAVLPGALLMQDPGAEAEASHKAGRLAPALYSAVKHGHVEVVLLLKNPAWCLAFVGASHV